MENNTLYHHGIRGMRWGVRRTEAQLGQKSSSHKSSEERPNVTVNINSGHGSSSNTSAFAKELSGKELHDSNIEMRERLNRIKMEKEYADLTAPQKSAGAKFVSSVLNDAGKRVATDYTAKAMTKVVEDILKKTAKKAG